MLSLLSGLSKIGGSPPPAFAAAVTGPRLLSPMRLSVEVRSSLSITYLPCLRSTLKNDPPVQRGGPPAATGAGTDADPIHGPRNHVPQPDLLLIRDESRQTNLVRPTLSRLLGFVC